MIIGFDAKRYYHNHTGLGNYSRTLIQGLQRYYPEEQLRLYDEASFSRTFSLGKKAKREGCTLFHGLSNELPFDLTALPSVVTLHDVAWRTFPAMYQPVDRLLYDYKYGHSARHASHVVAISESTRRDVIQYLHVPAERVSVIYQPVETLFYTPLTSEEADRRMAAAVQTGALPCLPPRDYVLTVGSINSRKNLLGLLKALATMPHEQRPYLLVVGRGHGAYRKEVEAYIHAQALTSVVCIAENVSENTTLQALYTRAAVLAYPSFYEGFGLPVVEAALQGCPVLTSTVSSLPEAAGPGALTVDPSQVEAIAYALSQLLASPRLRGDLGCKGQAYARAHFNPPSLFKQLYDLYLHLSQS